MNIHDEDTIDDATADAAAAAGEELYHSFALQALLAQASTLVVLNAAGKLVSVGLVETEGLTPEAQLVEFDRWCANTRIYLQECQSVQAGRHGRLS